MAGINLSQSEDQFGKPRKKDGLFDTGTLVSLIILFTVALIWGGLRLYMSHLDKKIASLDGVIAEHNTDLQGETVNRVADFEARRAFIAEKKEKVDSNKIFAQLEASMVPTNRLVQYEYNEQDGVVTLRIETDNFRYIAEQIISLRSTGSFSEIKTDQISRGESGKILVSLKAYF